MGAETAFSSREGVLRRIRAAIGGSPADAPAIRREWKALSRSYKRTASIDRRAILEMLEDRLRDYDANVVRAKAGEVGAAIAQILAERGLRRLLVPVGLGEALGKSLPGGIEFVVDDGLTTAELDSFEGVVTAS
jgi:L-lactate dehydrogenase complex protein LldG